MKKILGLLLFFLVFILLGVYFSQNSGSIHLYIDSWKIQMPLWLVMLGLVCFYLFLFVLGKLLRSCWGALSFLGNIKQGLNTINVKDNLKKGLFSFIRGDFKTAERFLLKVTNVPKEKVSAVLALVMVAEARDDLQKARNYLSFLKLQNTDDEDVDSLVRIMLALNVKNYQEAEYLLDGLAVTFPHNNRLLLLKKRLYLETKNIDKLQELLPLLKRYSTVTKEELAQLRNIVDTLSVEKLVAENVSFETWNNFWQGLTKEQQTIKLLKQFIAVCLANKEYQLAEPLIRNALNTEWDEQLIGDYGKLSEVDYKKQFTQGEKWLLLYPDNAPLLLTLAEIAIKLQLWGQAEHYLNRSIAIKPMSRAYFALAELQAHLDNNERKQRNYYIESAKLSLSSV